MSVLLFSTYNDKFPEKLTYQIDNLMINEEKLFIARRTSVNSPHKLSNNTLTEPPISAEIFPFKYRLC